MAEAGNCCRPWRSRGGMTRSSLWPCWTRISNGHAQCPGDGASRGRTRPGWQIPQVFAPVEPTNRSLTSNSYSMFPDSRGNSARRADKAQISKGAGVRLKASGMRRGSFVPEGHLAIVVPTPGRPEQRPRPEGTTENARCPQPSLRDGPLFRFTDPALKRRAILGSPSGAKRRR